ncbi:MAG TPA: hypothetical protein VFM45_13130 [Anaeromyxobacteraceae bacterium]|nr:hypothetical protein [Anaeromyxobacteraceae bacterium]
MRPRSLFALLLLASGGCIRAIPAPRLGDDPAAVAVRFEDPADAGVARQVQNVLPAALSAASRWGTLREPVTITVHPTHAALEAAARQPGLEWLRAWARRDGVELQSPRTWSAGTLSDAELAQLLAHELTHCAMYQSFGIDSGVARTVPIWFREGLATVAAGERFGPAAASGEGTLAVVNASYRTDAVRAYATADSAFRCLLARHGEAAIRAVLAHLRAGEPFPAAFRAATGVSLQAFEEEYARSAGGTGGES